MHRIISNNSSPYVYIRKPSDLNNIKKERVITLFVSGAFLDGVTLSAFSLEDLLASGGVSGWSLRERRHQSVQIESPMVDFVKDVKERATEKEREQLGVSKGRRIDVVFMYRKEKFRAKSGRSQVEHVVNFCGRHN